MKRILAIFLTIAMVGAVIGGCGNKEEGGDKPAEGAAPATEGGDAK